MQGVGPILTLLSLLSVAAANAFAQMPSDPKKGRAFALEACTPCHVVARRPESDRDINLRCTFPVEHGRYEVLSMDVAGERDAKDMKDPRGNSPGVFTPRRSAHDQDRARRVDCQLLKTLPRRRPLNLPLPRLPTTTKSTFISCTATRISVAGSPTVN